MSKSSGNSGGIGFIGLLTIAFVVLRLCEVIDWSWWWVLSPLWMPVVVGLVGWCVVMVCYEIVKGKKE